MSASKISCRVALIFLDTHVIILFSIYREDDKFGRRDRYCGPISDFKEKDNYKPNVKLDYIDDGGHLLSEKEAFRLVAKFSKTNL